jgi:hypothetical protein
MAVELIQLSPEQSKRWLDRHNYIIKVLSCRRRCISRPKAQTEIGRTTPFLPGKDHLISLARMLMRILAVPMIMTVTDQTSYQPIGDRAFRPRYGSTGLHATMYVKIAALMMIVVQSEDLVVGVALMISTGV